jgi:hypothetical protein
LPRLFAARVATLGAAQTIRIALLTPLWQIANAAGFVLEGVRSISGASPKFATPTLHEVPARSDAQQSGSAQSHSS